VDGLLRVCATYDVVASLGHTDADFDTTLSVIDRATKMGVTVTATHLFNAMPQLHHRNPGAAAALIDAAALERLFVELVADGVHLGKNDMPISEARRILGNEKIIGGTANTFADVQHLAAQGADYIGCGPFRYTPTKRNLAPILGLEGYRNILKQMQQVGISLPLIAIGGIVSTDSAALRDIGVSGIAISGAVLEAADPIKEMKKLIEI